MQKVLHKSSVTEQSSWHFERRDWTKPFVGFGVMALLMQACAVCAQSAQPVPNANLFIEQERRDAERALQQRAQQERKADVKLPAAPQASVGLLPTEESPCFKIDLVTLNTDRDGGPQDLLDAVGQTTSGAVDSPIGRCLGAKGVQVVIDRLQNKLIAQGYVTSRVLAKPQNLQNGTLALELILGKINHVQWTPSVPAQMHRASEWNILPMSAGDVLNLRDIEQALENYKRVPTAEADIQITPGTEPGTSNLIISHQQPMPFRLSATADDSGTRSTGKYQGSLTFSYDNWWNLSDLFYVTMLHDLGGAEPGQRGTRGHIVHYSVPFGYVRVRPGDLDGSGALLAGADVNLNLTGDLSNSGTIAGRNALKVSADNIRNLGGQMSADGQGSLRTCPGAVTSKAHTRAPSVSA